MPNSSYLNLKNCLFEARKHTQDYPADVIEMMAECIPHVDQTKKVVLVGHADLAWAIEQLKGLYE